MDVNLRKIQGAQVVGGLGPLVDGDLPVGGDPERDRPADRGGGDGRIISCEADNILLNRQNDSYFADVVGVEQDDDEDPVAVDDQGQAQLKSHRGSGKIGDNSAHRVDQNERKFKPGDSWVGVKLRKIHRVHGGPPDGDRARGGGGDLGEVDHLPAGVGHS